MIKPYRVYFQREDKVMYLNQDDNTLIEQTINDKMIEDTTYNYFEMFDGYEPTAESAIHYRNDFEIWCNELKLNGIYYQKYFHHNSAVMLTFKRYASRQLNNIKFDLKPTFEEFINIESCHNGGLIYFDKAYTKRNVECYGKDYSSFYPTNLSKSKLKIPIRAGHKMKLKKIKFKELQFGIYHVKITCSNPDFYKVFSFSKRNRYTHYSLKFAYKYRKQFDVSFELDKTGDYNAIIYDDESLINASELFENWYDSLMAIKTKHPKNKLVKHLLSSLWGSLCQFKKIHFNEEEFNNLPDDSVSDWDDTTNWDKYKILNEKITYDENDDQILKYVLVESENAYSHPLARMKPFLLSYSRNIVGTLIIKENLLSDVIRINTDGIILKKDYDFSHLDYYPKTEDKTTGLIYWEHVNSYKKV
jgi:hypothetical protein